jgi:hypothetical protein
VALRPTISETFRDIIFVKSRNRATLAASPVSSIALTERQGGGKGFLPQGGQRNPLKRLISAKEIQGNPSFFL